MKSNKIKKYLVEISSILIGCVFIFSGFVKAVDPLGSAYKFQDYFAAFGMSWLNSMALPASFILSALEFALGVSILLRIYRKFNAFLILAFMLFMTPLTLYLAIADPVSDCGCFGDALVISNWETFFKNVILLAAAICIFLWQKQLSPLFSKKSYWLVTLYIYIFVFGVSSFCYVNLPILDFRPYKIGANIPELMIIPDNAPQDEYETTFIYSKDGVEKEFTLENYPANDSTWIFVDAHSKLIKKGYTPPIHDFTITNTNGNDITDIVLEDQSYTFLLIAYKFEKADDSNINEINEIYDYSKKYGYNFYALAASGQNTINSWIENTGAEYPVCTTDEITLKTIVRSNPGLILMKQGTIINKWAHKNIPSGEELKNPIEETAWGQMPPNKDNKVIISSALILFIPLLLLFLIDYFVYQKKRKTV